MITLLSKLFGAKGVIAVIVALLATNSITWYKLKAAKADVDRVAAECISDAERAAREATERAVEVVSSAYAKEIQERKELAASAERARLEAEAARLAAQADNRRLRRELEQLETESPDVRTWGDTRLPAGIIRLLHSPAKDNPADPDG